MNVMKVFTFAAALDSGAIFVDDVLDVDDTNLHKEPGKHG